MAPNHDEGSSVPLKYTVAVYTGMPKKTQAKILAILKVHECFPGHDSSFFIWEMEEFI